MEIIRHPATTRVLKAPPDWDHEKSGVCEDLPVVEHKLDGMPYMVSFWKPSPEELELLNKGNPISVCVQCEVEDDHPVLALLVQDTPT